MTSPVFLLLATSSNFSPSFTLRFSSASAFSFSSASAFSFSYASAFSSSSYALRLVSMSMTSWACIRSASVTQPQLALPIAKE
eukprot:CAMPEP_0183438918 /NCGR_PEP_ID=MMETSP0370-20130417/77685_1 /TAXON_ID=268820 /ORGANISM="Peridinium aciculiferum, Strain PAER-2" /LENGTH=82 /DNA_ID=CAMNT_0025627247 /DNA_START=477 /DNA_END=725 /DNA_ORIENTATION=-